MRILAVGDEESPYYWDFYEKGKLDDIDLIISCGDLKASYLEFLATFSNVPVLYVHGNHDGRYERRPPEGCICIDDDIYVYNGIRIMGLGGCMCYSKGPHQYTEQQMTLRIWKMRLKLLRRRGFDILVTHAPAFELNDDSYLPHRGFKIFRTLMDKFKPRFFLHGHVHLNYGRQYKRYDKYKETHVINVYERCVFDYEDENIAEHVR